MGNQVDANTKGELGNVRYCACFLRLLVVVGGLFLGGCSTATLSLTDRSLPEHEVATLKESFFFYIVGYLFAGIEEVDGKDVGDFGYFKLNPGPHTLKVDVGGAGYMIGASSTCDIEFEALPAHRYQVQYDFSGWFKIFIWQWARIKDLTSGQVVAKAWRCCRPWPIGCKYDSHQ
jgi:hypothetical protein